jgi:hypothetical protein
VCVSIWACGWRSPCRVKAGAVSVAARRLGVVVVLSAVRAGEFVGVGAVSIAATASDQPVASE